MGEGGQELERECSAGIRGGAGSGRPLQQWSPWQPEASHSASHCGLSVPCRPHCCRDKALPLKDTSTCPAHEGFAPFPRPFSPRQGWPCQCGCPLAWVRPL